MSTLEQEVRTLQKQVRRQRRWNIALGGLVLVGGLMAATAAKSVPDVIQAKTFEVVNDAGVAVVTLESFKDAGAINLTDKNGNMTFFALSAEDKDGMSLGMVTTRNGKGQTLVELGVTTAGEGLVETQNGKGGRLVKLGTTTDGEGVVVTENGKGEKLVELGVTTDGEGFVETQNGKGQNLVSLSGTPMGGKVLCTNSAGNNVVAVACGPDGEGRVMTMDAAGKEMTSITPALEP